MARKEQIEQAAREYVKGSDNMLKNIMGACFVDGAKWADENNVVKWNPYPECEPPYYGRFITYDRLHNVCIQYYTKDSGWVVNEPIAWIELPQVPEYD